MLLAYGGRGGTISNPHCLVGSTALAARILPVVDGPRGGRLHRLSGRGDRPRAATGKGEPDLYGIRPSALPVPTLESNSI
jgi:hypothetical protein